MTRDEAVVKLANTLQMSGRRGLYSADEDAGNFVFCAEVLGILKLDEPKSTEQRILDIIQRHVSPDQMRSIAGAIKNAGVL